MKYRYQVLASEIIERIESGALSIGERLPGVRKISEKHNVSVATAIGAYKLLENEGYIEARARSGYYVTEHSRITLQEPEITKGNLRPSAVTGQEIGVQILTSVNDPSITHLAAAIPTEHYLPSVGLEKALVKAAKRYRVRNLLYESPSGAPELRKKIAARMFGYGGNIHPDDILITNGCQEALQLALRAITKPGDIVAIESPSSHMILQVIESLGLKAIEIPTHPSDGLSVDALEFVLQQWAVKACIVVPNFSNPLGYCMSEDNKKALVELIIRQNIPLIEDDVYGDLGFSGRRPRTCKSFDVDGHVIYCSSFSKTLSPGLRVGWIVGGKYHAKIEYFKIVNSLASPTVTQTALSLYLSGGAYDRHIRKLRLEYANAVSRMRRSIERYFPPTIKVTNPKGGFVLWIELPGHIDSMSLTKRLFVQGISIAPGPIFSASGKYKNYIRISCAGGVNRKTDHALQLIASQLVV